MRAIRSPAGGRIRKTGGAQQDPERKKIKSLHYVNALGTDFTVGMTDRYLFTGAVETGADGIAFTANMPTEEVFSSPDRRTANGKLVAAMPLVRNGVVIEHFSMTFRDGRIVDSPPKRVTIR